jgi:hypothetical protein
MKKAIYTILLILLMGAATTYYYVFVYSKNNHRDVQSETGIIISSDSLVAAYEISDSIANTKYLKKES